MRRLLHKIAVVLTPLSVSPRALSPTKAAFLLLRGPYAWWGRGWLGGDVYYNAAYNELDPGTPTSNCSILDATAGVFQRTYSKLNVTLDCSKWEAELVAVSV